MDPYYFPQIPHRCQTAEWSLILEQARYIAQKLAETNYNDNKGSLVFAFVPLPDVVAWLQHHGYPVILFQDGFELVYAYRAGPDPDDETSEEQQQ